MKTIPRTLRRSHAEAEIHRAHIFQRERIHSRHVCMLSGTAQDVHYMKRHSSLMVSSQPRENTTGIHDPNQLKISSSTLIVVGPQMIALDDV
ncbi:hypothetical protein AAC387_Pa04g2743 [Persea americana]